MLPKRIATGRLSSAEFQGLAEVPAAAEWFANLDNPRTRRTYQGDIEDFSGFLGITTKQLNSFAYYYKKSIRCWNR